MTKNLPINSESYWDFRFSDDWQANEGPRQSRFFARLAVENSPSWLIEQIRRQSLTFADWGCAQGDGTDVWASYLNTQQLVGVDFSAVAIEQASERYPAIRFVRENWLEASADALDSYDVVFSSNTLEHFHNPYEVLEALGARAKKAVVLVLPYRELERIGEHFYSFLPDNVPLVLSNGFRLVWSRVIDCRHLPNTHWSGDQIILVYAESSWVDSLKLSLRDVEIGQDDTASEVANLNQEVVARDGLIASLNQEVATRDGLIASLNQEVATRDGLIASLNQAVAERDGQIHACQLYIQDKEIYIAMLKSELERFNARIDQRALRMISRLKRLPYYTKRAAAIVKARGFAGLQAAIAFKLKHRVAGNKNSYVQPQVSAVQEAPLNATPNGVSSVSAQPLLSGALVILAGVPFDDVGGGQRAAQIARCALKTGRNVIYLYIFKKFNFELNQHVESVVAEYGLIHRHVSSTSAVEILNIISPDATLLIELPHREAIPYIQLFNSRGMRTVFELIDDWESSLGGEWFNLDVYHRVVMESQVVIGTSNVLVKKLRDMGRDDAVYLPNAANEYIFDKYNNYPRPSDMPNGARRTALYFGSLYGEWFAWDYLQEAATANVDIAFVIIGDKPNSQQLPVMPQNVHFLGAKQIQELPAYLAHSDLCILPFSPGKISDAVSPIKVFEYLFSGRPVVSTKLPEIIGYPGVFVTDSKKEFAIKCKEVVFTDDSKRENDRFIFNNSWFSRLDKIVSLAERSKFKNSVSAITLIHNNKSIIGRCLESLLLHCSSYLKEVIVVDNASIDGGAEFVQENFPQVHVVRNSANGCSSGRNLGAQTASGEFLAFFDSDQWFTSSSCFEEALTILNREANVGAVGWAGGWFEAGRDDLGGMIVDYCPNRAMNDIAIQRGYRSDIGYLGTGGLFVPKSVFDATEGFDVSYDPTCFEDTDMSFQIKKLGFKICYRDLTGIRHQPHQTTKASSQSDTYTKLFKRNAEYFKKKWSGHPEFFIDYIP